MKKNRIIGISAFFHDSAIAMIENGKIVYAAQEERFSRVKHDSSFPKNALIDLLNYSKINLNDVDAFVFFEKPFLKFERLLETYLAFAPKGIKQFLLSMPIWLKEKLFMKKVIIDNLKDIDPKINDKKIFFSEHHLSHAASAFFPSPFKEAIIVTADGVGEWSTSSIALGKDNNIEIMKEIGFPNSLGLLYSAFTYYCGFKVNSGEYKLMGLAPFGKPKYSKLIADNLIDIKEDGSFRLNQKYFSYSVGFKMINKNFINLFGKKPRKSETKISEFHMDIAASIQKVTEDIVLKIMQSVRKEFGVSNVCLAGGVALNCVVNGILKKKKIFKNIWIQPASGDAGGSLGAALAFWHIGKKKKRIISHSDAMEGSFLGPKFDKNEISNFLKKIGAKFTICDRKKLASKIALQISKGKAIGWFQGRMEFGPRALGARSILADPRKKNIQKQLNLKIKFRESFRPFAPAILEEYADEWFENIGKSPYMLFVSDVKDEKLKKNQILKQRDLSSIDNVRSVIPGVTHVDNSARVQTVNKRTNTIFYELIYEFHKITKTPILINTSFNIRGEPIVCSPKDAFRCLMGTNLDILVIENFIIEKKKQDRVLQIDYRNEFSLD